MGQRAAGGVDHADHHSARSRRPRLPRERLASKAAPNRFVRVVECLVLATEWTCLYLHLSLALPPGFDAGGRDGGCLLDYRTDVRESRIYCEAGKRGP